MIESKDQHQNRLRGHRTGFLKGPSIFGQVAPTVRGLTADPIHVLHVVLEFADLEPAAIVRYTRASGAHAAANELMQSTVPSSKLARHRCLRLRAQQMCLLGFGCRAHASSQGFMALPGLGTSNNYRQASAKNAITTRQLNAL